MGNNGSRIRKQLLLNAHGVGLWFIVILLFCHRYWMVLFYSKWLWLVSE